MTKENRKLIKEQKQAVKYEKKLKRIVKLNKMLEEAKYKRYIPKWLDNVITIAVIGLLYYAGYYYLKLVLIDTTVIMLWVKMILTTLIASGLMVMFIYINTGKGE